MSTWQLPTDVTNWIASFSKLLDDRNAFRLLPIFAGILFGQGRRTVSSWLRAAGISGDYEDYYYFISPPACNAKAPATPLLYRILERAPFVYPGLLVPDDSST